MDPTAGSTVSSWQRLGLPEKTKVICRQARYVKFMSRSLSSPKVQHRKIIKAKQSYRIEQSSYSGGDVAYLHLWFQRCPEQKHLRQAPLRDTGYLPCAKNTQQIMTLPCAHSLPCVFYVTHRKRVVCLVSKKLPTSNFSTHGKYAVSRSGRCLFFSMGFANQRLLVDFSSGQNHGSGHGKDLLT